MPSEEPTTDFAESAPSFWALLSRELLSAAFAVLGVYVSARVIKRVMDPNAESRERTRQRREAVLTRLLRTGVPNEALRYMSPAEELLLHDLVFPEDISATFGSVGGLNYTKETLKELIVYPLLYPDVYQSGQSSLLQPPKGILLYGPPGTGKTMLAKALAKESGANFLALSPSSLLSKWLGDTEQLARAVFSLARRVQPTIIFIDEIDGLFRERSSNEHEAHKNLKAEFMQLWDGLTTDDRLNQVVVLGATNRPYDVDPAILRRMPRPFEVALPNEGERVEILSKVLNGVALEDDFDFHCVARVTDGYSGSDLKELCRAAMMHPIREGVRGAARERASFGGSTGQKKLRPLTLKDVLQARKEVSRTEQESANYHAKTVRDSMSGDDNQMDLLVRLLQAYGTRTV
ncbi:Protein MSP1 [Gracilariopsis chorda]|uniref:Protein MSP1 n=1 Tax=Gracilariopsis chorda TaxID=448386 RepID=A0A2V3J3F7_9FLOR|nr:Protein MSP1 [Gracilariopsis chorda]|eukprot:PXF48914.1 Protein MSP1 [Gracilariopsis chorda]